jgi:hypothetical protein
VALLSALFLSRLLTTSPLYALELLPLLPRQLQLRKIL